MTTSFPETKTGLRFGMATLAATACLAAVLAAGLPVRAQDNPVLAKVNGVEIRQSDVALAEEELGPSLAQMDPATKKDNVLAFLIDLKIVAKAAEDKKIENSEDFKKRLAFTRSRLLMDSLLAAEGKAATTEEAMKKVYEEASKQITGEMEVRARHILVETEDEAKAIAEELKKGADFAELAKKKSKDPGASDGGDLGFFTKEQMVPEFSTVAFTLEPGKISDPVKSQFGWHLIKVEERQDRTVQPYETVNERLRIRMRAERREGYSKVLSDSLRAYYNAVIFEDSIRAALTPNKTAADYFKEAQAATTPVQRIQLYRDLIERFPQDSVSVQAKFMIGFTYAEEMGEYEMARSEFEEFLRIHPGAELAGSAKWMLENMEKPAPSLDENAPPEGAANQPAPDAPPPGSEGK
jgi:peptidyl-prolyl cis-trans isomerase C